MPQGGTTVDSPNIAVANAADKHQCNRFQVVSNFLRLFKHKCVRDVYMKYVVQPNNLNP
jgi:hypothetical protein